jgi:hypothetical protein
MAATAQSAEPAGFVALSRAVVSAAADLVAGVERAMAGDGRVRTAQGNAWDAIQADLARAQAREEMNRLVAALLANEAGHTAARRPGHTAARRPGNSAAGRKAALMSAGSNSAR